MLLRIMLFSFLSGPITLLRAALWVFFLVVPLVWLDNYVKRRTAATMKLDRKSLSRFG